MAAEGSIGQSLDHAKEKYKEENYGGRMREKHKFECVDDCFTEGRNCLLIRGYFKSARYDGGKRELRW